MGKSRWPLLAPRLGFMSLIVLTVSVDVKQHMKKKNMRIHVPNSLYGLCGRKATYEEEAGGAVRVSPMSEDNKDIKPHWQAESKYEDFSSVHVLGFLYRETAASAL